MKVRPGVRLVSQPSADVAADTTAQANTTPHIEASNRLAWWIARSSALGLALIGGAGCAADGTEAPEIAMNVTLGTETSIFGGEGDDDERALGSVLALKVGSDGTFELCSGALVAPNVVLTARHCVAKSVTTSVSCDENGNSTNGPHVDGQQEPDAVAVYTGATPRFAEEPEALGKAIVAPKSDSLCDSDIALVVLDRALTGASPIAVRLGAGVAPGETIRAVGYGQSDTRMPLGTRLRKAGVEILAMGSAVSESRTALGPHEFEVGRSICLGDSGGPAISETSGAVIGVVSRGGDCEEDFGHIYTTTTGWEQLFDEAFALAGGAPSVESESERPSGGEPPEAKPIRSSMPDERIAAQSCSTTRRPTAGSASLALVLAGALVLAARARLRGTSPGPRPEA